MENSSRGFGHILALSELMNVGVAELDPTGDLIFANPLACRLLGSSNEVALRNEWPQLRIRLHLDGDLQAMHHRSLTANLSVDSSNRMLRLEVAPVVDHGLSPGYLVLFRDRRVLDDLEADLILASKMRAQVQLYGSLTHDLRAPLNAMHIAMELLADTLGNGPPSPATANPNAARQWRYVEVMKEELMRLNHSVQAILGHGAPLNTVAQAFDLAEATRESAELLRPQASRQNVLLQIALPERTAMVFGHRDRLTQALLNLAMNGLASMQDGGRLEIGLMLKAEAVTLTLRHTGPALPETVVRKIYQVHLTNGDHAGLYVARLIVESHGGEMSVQAPADGGVSFLLTFPYARTISP